MRATTLSLICLALAPVALAQASTELSRIRGAAEAKRSAERSATSLAKQLDDAQGSLSKVNSQMDMWDGQRQRLDGLFAAYERKVEEHNARAARADAETQRWNAACEGERPDPIYQKCMSEAPVIDRLNASVDANADALDREADDLEAQDQVYVDELDKLEPRKAQLDVQVADLTDQLDEARRLIVRYESRMRDACASARTLEALSYCHQIVWDGAPPNLPELPDDAPRGTRITPNN